MFRNMMFAHEERGFRHGSGRAWGQACSTGEEFTRGGSPEGSFGPERFGFEAERGGHDRGERGREGHGRGGFGPWGRGGRHGFGGRERLFEGGDLKLVILSLLSDQPSYGYQLIKRLEERMAGGYTPSAGVIYPTLTLLEEEGLTTGETADGKKVFTVTEAGRAYLQENAARLAEIHARLEHQGGAFQRGRSPEIMRAFLNLRSAIQARAVRGNLTPEQVEQIAAAIDKAAAAVDAL